MNQLDAAFLPSTYKLKSQSLQALSWCSVAIKCISFLEFSFSYESTGNIKSHSESFQQQFSSQVQLTESASDSCHFSLQNVPPWAKTSQLVSETKDLCFRDVRQIWSDVSATVIDGNRSLHAGEPDRRSSEADDF